MIGLFGVVSKTEKIDQDKLKASFNAMASYIDDSEFEFQQCAGDKFHIGLCIRKNGNNKDLSLKRINKSLIISFNGYGKFKGDKEFKWADTMVDKSAQLLLTKGISELTSIQGSFEILICSESDLYIISDRFGSRRLFYYDDENCLIFAPDVGQVLSSNLIKKAKNLDTAIQILIAGYPLNDDTLVKGVRRVPFSSIVRNRLNQPNLSTAMRYWQLPMKEGLINKVTSDLVNEFSNRLSDSIEQLSGLDSNSAVQLSGGLDSRAIACYLHRFKTVKTLTYDSKQEAKVAKSVCSKIPAEYHYCSNKFLQTPLFQYEISRMIDHQRTHAVVNQFFFAPMIKDYLKSRPEITSLYDGVYMDEAFSGLTPVSYFPFNLEKFIKTYGGGSHLFLEKFTKLKKKDTLNAMEKIYYDYLAQFGNCDDFFRCQNYYLAGRLRNYVMEAIWSKESYGYVLKPGFDYDVLDFAHTLNPQLRRGMVYTAALTKDFPEVMKVPYLDSYGTHKETYTEKVVRYYDKFRRKLSNFSKGYIYYYPYQLDYYFYKMGHINDYENLFCNQNYLHEIFTIKQKKDLFEFAKEKDYLFSIFQRILFIEGFYKKHGF